MNENVLLRIPVPNPFNLRYLASSHGWVDLPPFQWEGEGLRAVVRTVNDKAFALGIESFRNGRPGQRLVVKKIAGPRLSNRDVDLLREKIRWCFRLDVDFTSFQERCAGTRHLKWVKRYGLGPFLRNTDLFEEFAKVLITTNINWAGTKNINKNLLEHLGDPVGNARAFPTARRVAGTTEAFLRDKVRLGYRAPYLLELAEGFASGTIDAQSFDDPVRPREELVKAFRELKGFGPYAVNSLLITFNRFEELILDSWIRRMVYQRHFKGRKVKDASIRKVYAGWGEWAALACWFECAYDTWFKDELKGKGRGVQV
jgi:3-methyladenine DNA glycosylase/8-oxoguanine DNA glycosylase